VQYHLQRGTLYAQAVEKLQKHPQQEPILRQMVYAFSTSAELGNEEATKKLKAWQGSIDQVAPKGALAGLVQYRLLTIDRSNKIRSAGTNSKAIAEAQTEWRQSLTTFIKSYPAIEETPDAMYQLALAEEGNGKAGESEAVKVYEALVKNFPQHPISPTAVGSVRRLNSEGQPLALAGTTLDAQPIDLVNLKGKVVVVYYWGSFHSQLKNDATELAALQKKHGEKIAIVTVCLDQAADVANAAVKDSQLPGAHLFDASGNLATQYGVIGTQMFLVGKDGKVTNKNGQISQLADEVDRLMK
jgi:peroxiredoxin